MRELMQRIADTGRAVSWGTENWIRNNQHTTEYSAAIMYPERSKVEALWTKGTEIELVATVEEWAIRKGIVREMKHVD